MKKIDIMSLDGRQLALLIAVYEHRSVSAAAATFDISQSSASHTLDKLRLCLDDPLFLRTGRSLTPTDRAHDIVAGAREIVSRYDRLLSHDQYDPTQDEAPFVIALNVTEFLPEIRRIRDRILRHAPNARIKFPELGSRDQVEPTLVRNQADIAVGVQALDHPPYLNRKTIGADISACFYDPAMRGPIKTVADYCAAEHGVLDFGGLRKSTIEVALDTLSLSRHVSLAAANVVALASLIRGTPIVTTMQSRLANSVFSDFAFSPVPFKMNDIRFEMLWHRRADESARNIWLRSIVEEVYVTR